MECAENKSFVVQKSLITKHSDFFRACLRHDFQESRNSTIRLLDVDPDLMVLYLDLAHRQWQKRLRLGREVVILSRDYPLVADWARLIELYQLIDFLQNVGLLKQVACALRGCISFTPRRTFTLDAKDATIDRILEAFEMLEVNHRYQARFRDDIVSAFCKQCDWDVLVSHHQTLESHPEFLAKLSLVQAKYISSIVERVDPETWYFGEVPVSNHDILEAHPELLAKFSLNQAKHVASIMDQISSKPSSFGKLPRMWKKKAQLWSLLP